MAIIDSNTQIGQALRVVLPVIYIIIAIISVIGNLISLQIICANRFRHKAYHAIICGIIVADTLFTIIFMFIRSISYSYLTADWFLNVTDWCKAEMYLLKLFDFVLAYSIVFLAFDRVVSPQRCWFGVRRLRSGIAISISIWIVSAYILIPILIFKQQIFKQTYGGYICTNLDESITLTWLTQNPRRILDFLDILFRTIVPIFLMLSIMLVILFKNDFRECYYRRRMRSLRSADITNSNRQKIDASFEVNTSNLSIPEIQYQNLYPRRLKYMVFSYILVFMICQLPYEIYRATLLWNLGTQEDLTTNRIDFAIEIPLLILKLINRAVNPFLFMCLADEDLLRQKCCRLWCMPCIPGCIGCNNCWCQDCYDAVKYEINHCIGGKVHEPDYVPTGVQTVYTERYLDGDQLITKQKVTEELQTRVPAYYKAQPKVNIGSSTSRNENTTFSYTSEPTASQQRLQLNESILNGSHVSEFKTQNSSKQF